MTSLRISGLQKTFNGLKAVNDLTFTIPADSVFGIIGPNGAGKTSLFNCLTGFLKPTAGSVQLDGVEVLGKKPYELVDLGIARSFQLVKPFFGMTVVETLMVSAQCNRIRSLGLSGNEIRASHLNLLTRIGLSGKDDVVVDNLNQGELRLLDIARALATEPDFLFLDEPFSGLGQQDIDAVSSVIRDLRQGGITVVIIEHRLRELMRLVDRVMAISFGTKIAEGSPAEIVAHPGVIEAYLGTKGDSHGVAQH